MVISDTRSPLTIPAVRPNHAKAAPNGTRLIHHTPSSLGPTRRRLPLGTALQRRGIPAAAWAHGNRLQAAMKLTCLSTNGGGSYHSPASHILEVEGMRLLLDCPVDLSALAAFAPVPLAGDAEGLIRAVPRYWSPAAASAAKAGGVDAVLVSSATGMLGLPFLTRLPGFANIKVYETEVAVGIGKLMMGELVEMHREFVRYYGPDDAESRKWMEGEKVIEFLSLLQKSVIGDEGKDLTSLMPLYSPENIEECVQRIKPVKYGEEVCFNGILMLKASSSGLELGNCVWTIKGPGATITYLPSPVFVSAHALDFDHESVK